MSTELEGIPPLRLDFFSRLAQDPTISKNSLFQFTHIHALEYFIRIGQIADKLDA